MGIHMMNNELLDEALEGFGVVPVEIRKPILLDGRDGLLIGSGLHNGILHGLMFQGCDDEIIREYACLFDYIEVEPFANYQDYEWNRRTCNIREERERFVSCREVNLSLIRIGEAEGIPVVATSDSRYIGQQNRQGFEIMCRMAGIGVQMGDYAFLSTEELLSSFSYLSSDKAYEIVVENTNRIADLCENFDITAYTERIEELMKLLHCDDRPISKDRAEALVKKYERIFGIGLSQEDRSNAVKGITGTARHRGCFSNIPSSKVVEWEKRILRKYIRNQEIAVYFENLETEMRDYLALIHHGFIDVREKLEDIISLSEILEFEDDKRAETDVHGRPALSDYERISLIKNLYERVCSEIFNPYDRCLYSVNYLTQPNPENLSCIAQLLDTRINVDDIKDSIEEVFEDVRTANQELPFLDIPGRMEIEAEQIIVRDGDGHDIGVRFHVGWDGKKSIIYRFDILNDARNDRVFGLKYKSRMERAYEELDEDSFSFLPLPFETGCMLRLQTPLMYKPFVGKLSSQRDSSGYWYHRLYAEDADPERTADYIDLSFLDINIVDTYTSFDWIERVCSAEQTVIV